jgi:disulfide bond formation protein DsbB
MTLKDFTNSRKSWLLLMLFSYGCVAFAVFFQYYFDEAPCYLCIIQRIALLGIGTIALIPLLLPQNPHTRQIGYLGWLTGGSIGTYASAKLVYIQENPPEFPSCSMDANTLMENFGWMDSIPLLFNGSGDCTMSSGAFLGLSFEQWTFALFVGYTSTLLTIISIRIKQRITA